MFAVREVVQRLPMFRQGFTAIRLVWTRSRADPSGCAQGGTARRFVRERRRPATFLCGRWAYKVGAKAPFLEET